MAAAQFSFVILAFNEEVHLPRLLDSIKELQAPTFVLDSGSTDATLEICKNHNVMVAHHPFENHPKQWHYALNHFGVQTPWIVALDADQIVTPELFQLLQQFNDKDYQAVDGIYFNRKNFFKGKWLRYGGYYPKYLLKMFRTGVGFSDLNENMDHRFVVPGKTVLWKQGHLIEENTKENQISFWIKKHDRYSDLVAEEEHRFRIEGRERQNKRNLFGSPDERVAWLKYKWVRMPLFLRPFLYFFFRYFVQLGILDGRQGLIFHFLQALWFRFVVDVKILELRQKNSHAGSQA